MDEVVELAPAGPGVVLLRMADRAARNTFSPALIAGLERAFARIAASPELKAVVLTGYDNYFCSGATREELIGIHQGTLRFADVPFYDLPMRCEIPVVAAMQGHALGGGLVLGCYCDLMVMAEEGMYGAVFMKYGFTPGMGGTCLVPARLGALLGNEMLYTARNYLGRELRQRGAPARVVARQEVLAAAMALAASLAEKPRPALVALKRHLNGPLRGQLPAVIASELAMHGDTFHAPEVRGRIDAVFDGEL